MNTTRRAWAVFLGFFLLMAAWALASPLGSGPDEPAHVVKAAATVRLEFTGPHYLVKPVRAHEAPQMMTVFRVPRGYAARTTPCFAYHPSVSAGCARHLDSSSVDGPAATYVAGYNPTYYFLVGWPSLLVQGDLSIYLMRLCSAALNSALLALAALTVLQSTRRRGPMLGLLAAATPMVVYLGAVVNPNGTEAASAILVWTSLFALASLPRAERTEAVTRRLVIRALIGAALLANIRPLGPLWVGCAIAAAALAATPATRRAVAASRAARWCGLGTLAAIAAAGLWTLSAKLPLATEQIPMWTFSRAARAAVRSTGWYLREMIGVFGWLDAPAPTATYILAAAVLALLIVPVLSRPRFGPVLAALAVATVAVPIVAMGVEAHTYGLQWQGRYMLAFAVGVPIVAGWAGVGEARGADRRNTDQQGLDQWSTDQQSADRRDDGSPSRGTVCWCLWLTAAAGFAAFWWAMLRYAIGTRPSLTPSHAHWAPPSGWITALGVYVIGALLVVAGAWPERSAAAIASDQSAADAARAEPRSPASASASASASTTPQDQNQNQNQDILAER